jgi:hypothetical protein
MEIPASMPTAADYDKALAACKERMEDIRKSLGL